MANIIKKGDERKQQAWVLDVINACTWCGAEYQLTTKDKMVPASVALPQHDPHVTVTKYHVSGNTVQSRCPECGSLVDTDRPAPNPLETMMTVADDD